MKKKLISALLASAMVASLLAGCGSKPASPAPTAPAGEKTTDQAPDQGTESNTEAEPFDLHVAITANPPAMDPPVTNSNIVGEIGIHVYEGLFAMDANYNPTPVLAESYEVSEDGLVYTIKLRQGVKFHNGKELKAEDAVASMTYWLDHSAKAKTLIGGSTFEAVDDYTLKMNANKAGSDILMILASPIQFAAIYPAEVVAAAGETGITEYIGTGPYKFDEWKTDQYVKLSRNEEYQPSPNATEGGISGVKNSYADNIYFDVVGDETTRLSGVQSGQYQISEEIPVENYDLLAADSSIVLDVYSGGTLNLFLNTTKGIMAKPEMRQAVLAALNCDDIMLGSYGNPDLYKIDCGWMNPSNELWAATTGTELYNQNNVEKAKELLAKAGYNNEELVLVTTKDYAEMYNATVIVQQQLTQAGINAKIDSTDFAVFMEHRADPTYFDMFITSNSYNMLPIQLSVLDKGWAGLEAAEVSDGINAIRDAASPEEAGKAWADLQQFLYEDGAATVLGHFTGVSAHNAKYTGTEYVRFNIFWNVKPAK